MDKVDDRSRRRPPRHAGAGVPRPTSTSTPARGVATRSAPQRIRIVGGRWKRTPLPVPDVAGLRPTPDRVRETLFNWLGSHVVDADVLDLFAGTGALGFEAASRGARHVTLVESDGVACRSMQAVRDRLSADALVIDRDDAIRWLAAAAREGRRFDLVLLDPPFGHQWLPRLLPLVAPLVAADGRVYVEAEAPLPATGDDPLLAPWQLLRAGQAGQVHYHLLAMKAPSPAPRRREEELGWS